MSQISILFGQSQGKERKETSKRKEEQEEGANETDVFLFFLSEQKTTNEYWDAATDRRLAFSKEAGRLSD